MRQTRKVSLKKIVTSINRGLPAALFSALMILSANIAPHSSVYAAPTDEAAVRGAVEQTFQQLRAGDFGALYDGLPSASRRRITRTRFVNSMGRARGTYELDRMEIAAVHVAGDLAVVETVLYGRVRRPIQGDGKIIARQHVVREGGRWRVAAGDAAAIRPLLAANPAFARKFPPTTPRIYLKQNGRWIDVSALAASQTGKRR